MGGGVVVAVSELCSVRRCACLVPCGMVGRWPQANGTTPATLTQDQLSPRVVVHGGTCRSIWEGCVIAGVISSGSISSPQLK